MKKVDILDLEYASNGRDIDIVEPILSRLSLEHGLKIERECCFNINWPFLIIKNRPKLVIIANSVGSQEHFAVVKFSKKLGINVVCLDSEGDYHPEESKVKQFYWGWNKDKVRYEDLHLIWSERVNNLIKKYILVNPEYITSKRVVSGAVGFDKYKLLDFISKEEFLEKYEKSKFKKVIGYAGFGFHHFEGIYYKNFKETMDRLYSQKTLQLFRDARLKLNTILKELIKEHKDTLFIFKHHPLSNTEVSEFQGIEEEENVLFIKNEHIADVMNVCDIWMGYETTTCLEAWLLGKPTLLINPISYDFNRSIISQGSPKYKSKDEVSKKILSYYQEGTIVDFDKLSLKREKIIKEVIGFADGKNHKRAADELYKLLKKSNGGFNYLNLFNFYIIKILIIVILKNLLRIRILSEVKAIITGRRKNKFSVSFSRKERLYWKERYESRIKSNLNAG